MVGFGYIFSKFMKEHLSNQNPEEIPHTPEEKWADISKRVNKIEASADAINQNMSLLPETDSRRMAWVEIARKVEQVMDAFSENQNLGVDPEPKILELLKEAENAIKNFVS
jgi:hypothetical protein